MMIGGAGIPLGLRGRTSNAMALQAGTSFLRPAGRYLVAAGPYSSVQFLDPVTNIWRNIGANGTANPIIVEADGANWRIANLTGCAIGALITNVGATGATTGIGATATNM